MLRRIDSGARLGWALVIGMTCILAVGCGGGGSGGGGSGGGGGGGGSDVKLSGVVDDGGPGSPIPGAICRFFDDAGPIVGPVTADANGRFTLEVPKRATGRVECIPPGMIDMVLSARVALGSGNKNIGEVGPESSLIAAILETEIDEGEIDPDEVGEEAKDLEDDDDLAIVVTALNLAVDAFVDGGLDTDLLEATLDLHDNGQLDGAAFAGTAPGVNAAIAAQVGSANVARAIETHADGLFGDMPIMAEGKILIEHNATDEDTGFQGFGDGDPWNQLTVTGPAGGGVLTVDAQGGLRNFGLTELFFETSEPENAEVPIEDVLARLAEGQYSFTGDLVGSPSRTRLGVFTHDIPAGPVLVSPAEDAEGLSPNDLLLTWLPVTQSIEGGAIDVIGYQVIVEEDVDPEFPDGFAQPEFSVYLPATATQIRVPNGFLKANGCYKWEVLAIERSGNQTLSEAAFETGTGCPEEEEEEEEEEEPELSEVKLLIEHNATDRDTGFQCFVDGDPWNEITITGPGGVDIVRITAEGGLFDFGLTELFFETSEPENDEVSISEVLARLPEGTYTVTGDMVDGEESEVTATFTHKIPTGPVLLTPEHEKENVDPADTVVSWQPVTTDINGAPVTIVGYQVIVERDIAPEFPHGFAQPWFSIFLPATVTQVKVPAGFMEGDTEYEYEVLAIEESGNQSIASAEFATR